MKKFLSVLLMSVIMFSLVACGGTKEPEKSPEELIIEDVKSAVSSKIIATIIWKYDTEGTPIITHYVDEISENKFEVTGKVTVRDKYGDTYTGKYDAIVEYDPAEEDSDIVSFNLGTLYKDK